MSKPPSKYLFDFQAQLVAGNNGELEFQNRYHHLEPKKSEDRKIDFFLNDGSSVELKTDTYDMADTANFFMELYSDNKSGAIGGPWRSAQDGVRFFVYYYQKNKVFYWFESDKLCSKLEDIVREHKLKLKTIRNKGWNTQGYCVPREFLTSVMYKEDRF